MMNFKTKVAIVSLLMALAFALGYVVACDTNSDNNNNNGNSSNNFNQSQIIWNEGFSAGRGLSADIGEWPSSYGKYVEVAYFNDSHLDNVTGTEKLPQGKYEYRVLIPLTENANGTKMMRMHPIFVRNPEGERSDNVTRLLKRVTQIE